MIKEQLMEDRYEVLTTWPPNNNCHAGEIVTPDQFTGWHPKDYPIIFRRLEWWEKRNLIEYPDYVKDKYNQVHKSYGWGVLNGDVSCVITFGTCKASVLEPATEQEYTDYIKSKK